MLPRLCRSAIPLIAATLCAAWPTAASAAKERAVGFGDVTIKINGQGTVIATGRLTGAPTRYTGWRIRLEERSGTRWRAVPKVAAPARKSGTFAVYWVRGSTTRPGHMRLVGVRGGKARMRSDLYVPQAISLALEHVPRVTTNMGVGTLYPGDSISSPDGEFRATFQKDGNLVITDRAGHTPWSSGTAGHPDATLNLSETGVLSIDDQGQRLWATPTEYFPRPSVVVTNAGVLTVRGGSVPIWSSVLGYTGDRLYPRTMMASGDMLLSESRNTRLVMEWSGALVLSRWSGTAWIPGCSTGTTGATGAWAYLDENSTFEVISEGSAVWSRAYADAGLVALRLTDTDRLQGLYADGSTRALPASCM